MVLEKLVNPQLLRRKPFLGLPTAFFFVVVSFILGYMIFQSQVSLVMVFFFCLIMLPYIIKVFEFDGLDVDIDVSNSEDLRDWIMDSFRSGYSPGQVKKNLMKNKVENINPLLYSYPGNIVHGIQDDIRNMNFFFEQAVDSIYDKYIKSSSIWSRHKNLVEFYVMVFLGTVLGYMLVYSLLDGDTVTHVFKNQLEVINPGPSGLFKGSEVFTVIVENNLKITLICVLLSLLYGSGAIFILTYNASIAAVMY